jgi:hypothetical protein
MSGPRVGSSLTGNGATYTEQDDGDGGGAARTPLADPDALDTAENGHEHDGKERTDVEQRDLVPELIGDGQPDAQREGEDDVAAQGAGAWLAYLGMLEIRGLQICRTQIGAADLVGHAVALRAFWLIL